jgi:hypothetical protein
LEGRVRITWIKKMGGLEEIADEVAGNDEN